MPSSPQGPQEREPQTFQDLQGQYLRRMTETIETLREWLRMAEHGTDRNQALQELCRAFHRLAGSGATYGYPAISEVGRAAEAYLEGLLETERPLPFPTLTQLSLYIRDLEAAHAEETKGP